MNESLDKICTQCKEKKSLDLFSMHKGFKDGRNSKCKECKCRIQKEGYNSGRYSRGPYTYAQNIKDKYGLSMDQYKAILESQSSKCAICGLEMKKPNIDHCHKSGNVRGILCTRCNTGLGKFKDDPELLKNATNYLIKNGGASLAA